MKVLKSWGASGEVVLSLSADDPRDWKHQEPVFIAFDGAPVPFFIESATPRGGRLIVKFEDIDTLAEAEELVGREVLLSEEEEEEEDTLIGLQVRDSHSRKIVGTVVDFSDYGGNTLITLETEKGEILVPIHEDLIVGIHDDILTLDIPEGLI